MKSKLIHILCLCVLLLGFAALVSTSGVLCFLLETDDQLLQARGDVGEI